ncbi:hypothetical protein GCM10009639_47560 [Kitasatospora putterlickiae]|uniref:Uncharacterized protein n=1 Tax=Kitasatospora putterlickiae TaxID=221725 RepID=A0ABP4J3U3_9ACTN
MPRYTVRIDFTETYEYEVEADNPDDAEAEALDLFDSDAREDGYSHGHEPEVRDAQPVHTLAA